MDGKQLIVQMFEIAREQGLSQAEWSRKAGFDEFGKIISNTFKRYDCKLKVMTQLLKPLGYELIIVKKEGNDELRCPLKECILGILGEMQNTRLQASEIEITR